MNVEQLIDYLKANNNLTDRIEIEFIVAKEDEIALDIEVDSGGHCPSCEREIDVRTQVQESVEIKVTAEGRTSIKEVKSNRHAGIATITIEAM